MNCPKCNAPNQPEAQFCKNCGTPLKHSPAQNDVDAQTIKSLLIIMGIDYLFSTIMFIIHKFVLPSMYKTGDSQAISSIYQYFGWTTDIILIGAMVFFLTVIKNQNAKTALAVFIVLRLIFFIGYRLLNLPFF